MSGALKYIGGMTGSNATGRSDKYNDPVVAQKYHANRYGDWQGRLNLWAMSRALDRALAHVPAGGRVLDVPCGTGQYCWRIAEEGFHVVAADVAPEMVKTAAVRFTAGTKEPPEFMVENIFRLSFPVNSFDGAICIRLFNLLGRDERIAALQQLSRVADTVIASYSHPYTIKHFNRLLRYQLGLRRKPSGRLSRQQLKQEVSEAGLQLRELIPVAPLLSEVWLAVLSRSGPCRDTTAIPRPRPEKTEGN